MGQLINSGQRSETADGVARESEGRTRLHASTPSTTRSAARTFWRMPMPSAAPTSARRAWTVRTSRPSRRMGGRYKGWPRTGACAQVRLTETGRYQTRFHNRRPTANSTARWRISTLRDRVCMTAAMLVLEADLRGRPSLGTLCLPPRAERLAGGGRGRGAAVSRPSGRGGRRPRGLLRAFPIPSF